MTSLIQELLSHFAQVLPAPPCSDAFFHLVRAQISLLNFKKGGKDTLESTFNSACLSLRWLFMVCVEQFFIPLLNNIHGRNFKLLRRPGPCQNKFYTLFRKPKVVSQKNPENTQSLVLNVHTIKYIQGSLFFLVGTSSIKM